MDVLHRARADQVVVPTGIVDPRLADGPPEPGALLAIQPGPVTCLALPQSLEGGCRVSWLVDQAETGQRPGGIDCQRVFVLFKLKTLRRVPWDKLLWY